MSRRVLTVELQASVSDYQSAMKQASKATEGIETGLKKVERAGKGLDPVRMRVTGVGTAMDRTAGRTKSFGSGLDKTSKHARGLESGMSGLADGISGVTTIMAEGSKAPADMAIAFANIGSAASTTAIPAVKGLGRGLSGLRGILKGAGSALSGDLLGGFAKLTKGAGMAGSGIAGFGSKLKAMRGTLIAGGIVAGVTGLVFAFRALEQAAQARQWDDFVTSLKRGNTEISAASEKAVLMAAAFGNLDGQLRRIAGEGGIGAARSFVKLAESMGLPEESMQVLREELRNLEAEFDGVGAAADRAATAHQRFSDQMHGVLDPVLAAIQATHAYEDALARETEAQAKVNQLVAEGKEGTPEYSDALRALRDSHLGVTTAALTDRDAQDALRRSVDAGEITAGELKAELDRLTAAGYGSSASAKFLRDEIARLKSKNVNLTVSGTARAQAQVAGVRDALARINSKTVYLNVISTTTRRFVKAEEVFARQHGGPVRAHQAYLVGENQPEVFVPDRNGMVLPSVRSLGQPISAGSRGAAGWSGAVVNIDLRGAVVTNEDMFVRKVSQAVNKGTRLGLVNR